MFLFPGITPVTWKRFKICLLFRTVVAGNNMVMCSRGEKKQTHTAESLWTLCSFFQVAVSIAMFSLRLSPVSIVFLNSCEIAGTATISLNRPWYRPCISYIAVWKTCIHTRDGVIVWKCQSGIQEILIVDVTERAPVFNLLLQTTLLWSKMSFKHLS